MNSVAFFAAMLSGVAVAALFGLIGEKLAEIRQERKENAQKKANQAALKKDSERRKKANEQKERMETGDHSADFAAGIDALGQLRNKTDSRK